MDLQEKKDREWLSKTYYTIFYLSFIIILVCHSDPDIGFLIIESPSSSTSFMYFLYNAWAGLGILFVMSLIVVFCTVVAEQTVKWQEETENPKRTFKITLLIMFIILCLFLTVVRLAST